MTVRLHEDVAPTGLWISTMLVIGVLTSNTVVILGAQRASKSIGNIATEITNIADGGRQQVDSLNSEITSIGNKLSSYNLATKAVVSDTRQLANYTRFIIKDYIVRYASTKIEEGTDLVAKSHVKFTNLSVALVKSKLDLDNEIQGVKDYITQTATFAALQALSEKLSM